MIAVAFVLALALGGAGEFLASRWFAPRADPIAERIAWHVEAARR